MHAAEKIAEEVYQVYCSGKNGIVLEMEHKQEVESVLWYLQEKHFKRRDTRRIGLDIRYIKKTGKRGVSYAPAFFQMAKICPVEIKDQDYGLDEVLPESYLAAGINQFASDKEIGFIVLNHYHLIDQKSAEKVLQALLQILRTGSGGNSTLLLVTVDKLEHLPADLLPYIHLIKGRKPEVSEIQEKVNKILLEKGLEIGKNFRREIVSYLQGFHCYEIEYLFQRAELMYGEDAFDEKEKRILELIGSEKVKMLERDRLLEWKMVKHVDIANMEVLTKYLRESGIIMGRLEDAMEKGVEIPKGILIMGLPGTGKSLFAQYAASLLKLPLIRLEMGRMMGGHVGDSERNLRSAQKQAEEMAPCILWIDEIEKGFAGSDGKKADGNDYLQRMTGGFLTWLQEKKSSCYIIATANSIEGMPPEFFRQGRFDRCFYTAMPSEKEVRGILKVHLLKAGRGHVETVMEEAVNEVVRLAVANRRFMTGADAGALVSNTFRRLYLDYCDQTDIVDKEEFDKKNLVSAIKCEFKEMKVFSETNGDRIAQYAEELKKSNFINASISETTSNSTMRRYDNRLEEFIAERCKKE